MVALGSAWAPTSISHSKPWMAQLKKHRFRASWQLSELQTQVQKLTEVSPTSRKVIDLGRQAEELARFEMEVWKERLMSAALGDASTSIISQLVAAHKLAQTKLRDHHEQKNRLLEKQQASAVRMLEGQFRLEKLQLIEKMKIKVRD